MRALLEAAPAVRGRLGPFSNIERAWTVLAESDRHDPAAVEQVLMMPSIGVWLNRALRQTLGRPPDSTSIQLDVGWFHAVAAAAAIRCEVSCTLPVPVVHGAVCLPSVGIFRLPTQFPVGHADVTVAPSGVSVTACGGTVTTSDLEPLVRHRSTARGALLETTIDVLDPYRTFGAPEPAGRLAEDEHASWTKQLDEAWDLLTRWHPGEAEELAAGLTTLVPLPAELGVFAASSSSAFGGIAMSPKPSATECAEALIHELQHSKINAVLDLVVLCKPEMKSALLYAPWRDEPRPLAALLHGLYAFVSVVEFWHVQRPLVTQAERRQADFRAGYRADQLGRVVDAVYVHPGLTDLGRELVSGVAARLVASAPADLPPDIAALIDDLTSDHYAIWRLRHVRPADDAVTRLADDWLAGAPAVIDHSGEMVLPRPGRPFARATLLKAHSFEPQRFERLPQYGPDTALARGEHDLATNGYLDRITEAPTDVTAWAGLALSTRSPSLLHIPELVRATWHRLNADTGAAPNPLDLAAWFDRTGPPAAHTSLRHLGTPG
ncbi:HEXXH motif domain-containing protein [Amycolatopsis japonica]|uniref:HEXXH motif domain-containing protein n=1 Tax=Amycolatopsis japonica TaxID=208439 RepID=UPI0034020C45